MRNISPVRRSVPSVPLATDTTQADLTPVPGDVGAGPIAALHAWLLTAATPGDDPARIDTLRALEQIKAACVAVQAHVLVELHDDTLRAAREHAAAPARHHDSAGRQIPVTVKSAERDATASTIQQAAHALRLSPHRTRTLVGAARIWHEEMPHTLAALKEGRLSEERALLLVKETACLTLEDRGRIDADLCADPTVLDGVGTRRLVGLIKARANQIDPAALVKRAAKAVSERCVSIRPAPDAMAYVTALLPMAQGVQVYAALKIAAESARYTGGDERSTGQIMADTLVERATGQEHAADVPVTVNLIVSDAALLGEGHEPAVVLDGTGVGHGTVPASVARTLVAGALDLDAAWLRAIYATTNGDLIGTTSKRRFFADGLADLLRIRDQGTCRTSWCDAPIRHLDHVRPAADGGETGLANGQGLCAACNQAKEACGWRSTAGTDPASGRHVVVTTTPTGHSYRSVAPPPPRPARQSTTRSVSRSAPRSTAILRPVRYAGAVRHAA
ncbi:HNH endonuclease [Promicromonospora umidemergens]|uniref:DUF222 domain-containing protein n=1 Tax=Promicromonospora umidemergens TaxID=629679 RepID=A0ABP8WTK8_9MICO|nr:HNH endonuclease [Promicromonospora umidemergens]MCP2283624.1 HNH endonuclease [Promicromonospora umidemergens]